ncbi:MAG: hypothetical protein ACPGSC_00550 [Granulosicoccaceae bacterium]
MAQNSQKMPTDAVPISSSVVAEFIPIADASDERICADLRWAFNQWQSLCGQNTPPQWDEMTHQSFMPVSRRLMIVLADGDWRRDEFDVIYCGQHVADFLNQGRPVRYQQMRVEDANFEKNYQDVKTRNGRVMETQQPELVMKRMDWADMRYIQYQCLILPFLCEGDCRYVVHVMEFKLSPGTPSPDISSRTR